MVICCSGRSAAPGGMLPACALWSMLPLRHFQPLTAQVFVHVEISGLDFLVELGVAIDVVASQ